MNAAIVAAIIAALGAIIVALIGKFAPNPDSGKNKKSAIVSHKVSEKKRKLFLAGCGVGNRLALLPVPTESDEGASLREFIDTLREIGLRERVISPIVEIKDRFSSSALEDGSVKALVGNFMAAVLAIPDEVKLKSTPEEFQWFKFGQLLYEVGFLGALGESAAASATALESVVETMELPTGLRSEVEKFLRSAKVNKKPEALYENANKIAQASYLLF